MTTYVRMTLALVLLCVASSTATLASSMYIVQGLPGRDLAAATDPAYPVDVLLNDEVCYQRGLAFGTVAGPLTFEPGSYNIKVSIANSLAPCSNSPFIDSLVTIEPRTDTSAVIALGESGTPKLLTFANNLSPVAAGTTRLLLAQAADAPAVQVILQNTKTLKLYTYAVKPRTLLDVTLPSDNYSIEINQGTTTLVASTPLTLPSQSVTLVYAVGQASTNSVTLESRTLRDVL